MTICEQIVNCINLLKVYTTDAAYESVIEAGWEDVKKLLDRHQYVQ